MTTLAVLLVDDNATFLDIAARFLAGCDPGHIALAATAETAEEALEIASATRPDAVVTDLVLPALSGFDLIARLRAARPDLVLVALTVHDDEAHRRQALSLGADAFVAKADLGSELVPALLAAAAARRAPSTAPPTPAGGL